MTNGTTRVRGASRGAEVRITDQAVSRAVSSSFEEAVKLARQRAIAYNNELEAASTPGARSAIIDRIYRDVISYGIPEESFPAPGSPEEARFRIDVEGVVEWARRMRRETEDSLSPVFEQAINRVKGGSTASINFSLADFSEEQRDFCSLVFEAFNANHALQAPEDYVPGRPYTGTKRAYSEEDAATRRITAVVDMGGVTVNVRWPPWLFGQTSREFEF